jgi:hypothetical protein
MSLGFQKVEAPRFQDSRHIKVISPTHRSSLSPPPGNIPDTHFCYRMSQTQGHSLAGSFMSMKNSTDNIGNRNRDLPACSALPQPTSPPPTLADYYNEFIITDKINLYRFKQNVYVGCVWRCADTIFQYR